MNYDLLITGLSKASAKATVARLLASDLSTSLQKAQSRLENLPTVFKRDLSVKEVQELAQKLEKLGAVCRAVESKNPIDQFKEREKQVEINIEDYLKNEVTKEHVKKSEPTHIQHTISKKERTIQFSKSPPKEQPKKSKRNTILFFLLLAGVIIFIIWTVLTSEKSKITIKQSKLPVSKSGSSSTPKKKIRRRSYSAVKKSEAKDAPQASSQGKKRKPAQIKSSQSYVDSARSVEDDYTKAIKFYLIAISFNEYNLKAWQGLIVAYKNAGMHSEAAQAKKRMAELFGDQIFSIEEVIAPYGSLNNYHEDATGTCRIEYASKESKQTPLERETFYIIRALLSQRPCSQVSLYAVTGKGSGMLVRVSAKAFPSSQSEYRKSADITFVK